MVYCIYLGICLHGSVYIIFNISVLNYMENSMSVFSCRCDFSWRFNTDREKNFPDGPLSTGKSPPTRKNIFPWWEEIDRENRHRQEKSDFFDGVQTVRVNDIIACRFCTAKEFYFLVGNPFFYGFYRQRKEIFLDGFAINLWVIHRQEIKIVFSWRYTVREIALSLSSQPWRLFPGGSPSGNLLLDFLDGVLHFPDGPYTIREFRLSSSGR